MRKVWIVEICNGKVKIHTNEIWTSVHVFISTRRNSMTRVKIITCFDKKNTIPKILVSGVSLLGEHYLIWRQEDLYTDETTPKIFDKTLHPNSRRAAKLHHTCTSYTTIPFPVSLSGKQTCSKQTMEKQVRLVLTVWDSWGLNTRGYRLTKELLGEIFKIKLNRVIDYVK